LAELTEELRVLNKIKTRHSPEIISIIERYSTEKAKYDASSKKTAALKTSLETVMSTVLKEHEESINKLLYDFGANFNIKEAHINYAGNGEAKSEYVLSMIGKDIPINANTSTFGTSLSEGDRRTLAFAFFMAVVLSDKDLDKKIVIIDDPMCSLDYNRKNQTTRTLLKLYKQSKQLFILAHDVFFIRGIRDSLNKANEEANYNILELSHIHGGYSNFRKIDLDVECESSYFKNHRILNSYITTGTPDKGLVAPCIRTMLEGYLHRRFPNILKKDCMFGEVVAQIVAAPATSPLHYAKNIVTELNEINLYAGQFHHDTKPDHPLGPINESELAKFCHRALLVTYQ
ncbi:AAA family ATPase, partial [Rahnella aceris]|uniref:AAA family ATPase n=1 Tax=Rahnella sp. (strain Y9602) TaxID=2703885 RepID=UPI001C2536EE